MAERDGDVVGALIAGWDGWRGNMYRLAVRDGHRREGIGLALTRAGEDYLRQRGVRRVTALVAFDDETAGAFWETAGYPVELEKGWGTRPASVEDFDRIAGDFPTDDESYRR